MFRNRLYYSLKPVVPWSVRIGVRRWFARRKLGAVASVWPIYPGSEKRPAGWTGWPENKDFSVVLTHDVEGAEGLAKVRQLAELEMRHGFRSSFNFVPEGDYRVSAELRDWLTSNGFEIGVHDLKHDGRLFRNRREFHQHAARINENLKSWNSRGFRAGFMLHELNWLHDLEVDYDCSTFDTDPFEPQPHGQKTIFPFWIPNPASGPNGVAVNGHARGGRTGYVEMPYTLPQDSTLFLLLREKSPQIWLDKLDWVAAHGGMVLVNVHPDYVRFDGEAPGAKTYSADMYVALLRRLKEKYANRYWAALPHQVAQWYKMENPARTHPVMSPSPVSLESVPEVKETPPVAKLEPTLSSQRFLEGKRAAVLIYSGYHSDPRPRRELEALLAAGAEVDLICLREEASQPLREVRGKLRIRRVPIEHQRAGKLRYLLQYSGFILNGFGVLGWASLGKRYDLVHVHNMPDVLVFGALGPKLRGAKVILDLHDPMPELSVTIFGIREKSWMVDVLKGFERASIGFANAVLTPNEAFRRLFCSRGCPPEKIHIVMNTPDEEIFNETAGKVSAPGIPREPGEFRLMFHGLIAERHGLGCAVKAMEAVKPKVPGIALDVYGAPNDYAKTMEQMSHQLGLAGRVRLRGRRPLEKIPAAILDCDLGIIPNCRTPFTEINFPTRIFEYLSLGKPVVVPRTIGIKDYFDESQILFFEPDDVQDLARVIQWAHDHPRELAEMVRRGQEVYRAHRWDDERERFLRVVRQLV